MKRKAVLEREDARYLRLRRAGHRPIAIARRCGVCLKTVYNGIERERGREAEARRAATVDVRGPKLTPIYGSSCKPLALLRCDDVHPNGPMPEGTACMCGVCHKTGVEGHPAMRIQVMPPKEKRAEAKPGPKPSRKQKRTARRSVAGAA